MELNIKNLRAATTAGARFSPGGKYRYLLTGQVGFGQGAVMFLMMNPSTADAVRNDTTIRRCIKFANKFGDVFPWLDRRCPNCKRNPSLPLWGARRHIYTGVGSHGPGPVPSRE